MYSLLLKCYTFYMSHSYSYDIKMILKMVIKTFHVAVRAGPDMYGVNYVKLHNSIYNLHLTVKM